MERGVADAFVPRGLTVSLQYSGRHLVGKNPSPTYTAPTCPAHSGGGWMGGRWTSERGMFRTTSNGEASSGHQSPKERILKGRWAEAAGSWAAFPPLLFPGLAPPHPPASGCRLRPWFPELSSTHRHISSLFPHPPLPDFCSLKA